MKIVLELLQQEEQIKAVKMELAISNITLTKQFLFISQ